MIHLYSTQGNKYGIMIRSHRASVSALALGSIHSERQRLHQHNRSEMDTIDFYCIIHSEH